jgi:hypothetical protein
MTSFNELPRRGLLGNSEGYEDADASAQASRRLAFRLRGGGGPLGPVNFALLYYPPFLGRRIVHVSNGRVRDLGVPAAIVVDKRYPYLATQDFMEFDPRIPQLTQSPGGFRYPRFLDALGTSLLHSAAGPTLEESLGFSPPYPRLGMGLLFS